jgi:DNA replication protein DnaC
MNLQIVHSLLEELGLDQAALVLESKAEQAAKGNWSYIEFLIRLLEEEVAWRKCRQTKHWPTLILMHNPVLING